MARVFDRLMSMGKVSAAVNLLSENSRGGVLSLESQIPCGLDEAGCPLTQSVKDILIDKHPLQEGQFLNLFCHLIMLMYHPMILFCLTV